jgi:tetratricopeptide (TPR) repeat protein
VGCAVAEGVQSAELNKQRRFAAFMSYAHADASIAAKLQSKLERYRLPKHLAQSHTGGQSALGQIFRDREDLAAAPSLSDAIRTAITEAEALVVICSPDAVASRWVGEEIALFRSLHPDRPILAAVVRGAPAEAFPAALTEGGNEPLAADLRKEADGPSLGFLKIVAGIAGVPLDALVQRDAQRRIRRVMWITGGALAAMLIMGIMTTLALSARNEAARQRAEAEGLVEYMLTDLREKLEGVGKIEIMEGVNHRAMGYYSAQGDLTRLPPTSLLQRARIIEAMGRDDENRGNVEGAKQKYLELNRVTDALLERDPNNPDQIFARAQSMNRVALLEDSKGNSKGALPSFEESNRLLQPLLSNSTPKAEWIQLGAYLNGNICAVNLQQKGSAKTALEHCKRAVRLNEKLVVVRKNDPSPLYDLIFHLAWLDDALTANGDHKAAKQANDRAMALVEKMKLLDPDNLLWREQEMQIYVRMADKLDPAKNRTERVALISKATSINERLLQRESGNALWLRYRDRLKRYKQEEKR